MKLDNKLSKTLLSSEFAQSSASDSMSLDGIEGFAIQAVITVTTPGAKTFVDGDVDTTENTITETAHGFKTGLKGQLTTDGVLPTGLSAATDYFVIVVDADTYQLASSLDNANSGTAVDITAAAGGGTHTFTPTAIAGASVKLQGTLDVTDGSENWIDISGQSANITATSNVLFNCSGQYYRKVRAYYTMTAGQLSQVTTSLAKALL